MEEPADLLAAALAILMVLVVSDYLIIDQGDDGEDCGSQEEVVSGLEAPVDEYVEEVCVSYRSAVDAAVSLTVLGQGVADE